MAAEKRRKTRIIRMVRYRSAEESKIFINWELKKQKR